MFRLGMGTHANPQKIWLKASTRLHTVDKYCTGGYYKRLREQCPFWGCPDFMDADMPPLTKGIEVFLRFAYAPIPKLFNDLQSERYFENRYSLKVIAGYRSGLTASSKVCSDKIHSKRDIIRNLPTSISPLSVIFISGITGRARNESAI